MCWNSYLMQIKDNRDSVCGKIPSKRFHSFKSIPNQPRKANLIILRRTSKYSWSYVPSTGSRPDHITPNRTCMWKINVDNRRLQCNVWQRSVRWCGTMFRPQELRSRANESSSSWGQYLRSAVDDSWVSFWSQILVVIWESGLVSNPLQ